MNFKRCVAASLAFAVLVIGSTHAGLTNDVFVGLPVTTRQFKFGNRKVISVSSVKCEATATGKSIESSKDALVLAVSSAVGTACAKYEPGFVSKIEKAYTVWAQAYAAAIAEATADCKTSGNAYGCAAATSYAKSVSTATAAAFASAASSAAIGCNCLPYNEASSLAKAFGTASTFERLTATAFSRVAAAVCAKNGQKATASVYQVCLASASAKVFAKATAEAIASTSCHAADSVSNILAVTSSTVDITEGCGQVSSASGSGSSATTANGNTEVSVEDLLSNFLDSP